MSELVENLHEKIRLSEKEARRIASQILDWKGYQTISNELIRETFKLSYNQAKRVMTIMGDL